MKPAAFEHCVPESLSEALALVKQYGEEAKVLAGGRTLMPLMNLRLARPTVIIDINRLSELAYIQPAADGGLTIGALTRQRMVERSSVVRDKNPLLAETVPLIGHFQIRNRGTIGGSLVHSDPAAELPTVCLIQEAELVLRRAGGERVIKAKDFFIGPLMTAIEPDEFLTRIRFPARRPGLGWAIQKVSRRRGDFALVGVAVLIEIDGNDVCKDARVGFFGFGDGPLRMEPAESILLGNHVGGRTSMEISRIVSGSLPSHSDIHASGEYRREVGAVLARRTLETALSRARKGTGG
ncbi:MAG: FAD binding domain-containing protein [Anaerolineae bacterium]